MIRKWLLSWLFADGDPRLRIDPQVDLLQRELSQVREERDHFRDLLHKHVGLIKDADVQNQMVMPPPVGGLVSWPRLKAKGEELEHKRALDAKQKYWEEKGASKVS